MEEQTGIVNFLSILNNISDRNTFSTLMTPITAFYYMDSFDISKDELNPQLVDVAITLYMGTILGSKCWKNHAEILTLRFAERSE